MSNSVERVLEQYLSPKLAKEASKKIIETMLVQTNKQAITTELMAAAKMDVLSHEVDRLIGEGYHVITIEGSRVL